VMCMPGSVGGLGGQPPRPTWPAKPPFLGGPSPSHESLRDLSYRVTPISAGPNFGEQTTRRASPSGHSFLPTAKRFSSIAHGVPGTRVRSQPRPDRPGRESEGAFSPELLSEQRHQLR